MPSISLGPEGCSEDNLVSDDDVCWQHGHASYRAQRPTRTQPSAMSAASSLDGTVARRAGRARRASPLADRSTGGILGGRATGAARSRISYMISYLAMRMHAAAASGESRASAARACGHGGEGDRLDSIEDTIEERGARPHHFRADGRLAADARATAGRRSLTLLHRHVRQASTAASRESGGCGRPARIRYKQQIYRLQ